MLWNHYDFFFFLVLLERLNPQMISNTDFWKNDSNLNAKKLGTRKAYYKFTKKLN